MEPVEDKGCDVSSRKADAEIQRLHEENERLRRWVDDLQSGMFVNCVYCGHRYGPQDKVPATMAEMLKQHVEQCPKHPMSTLKKENDDLREAVSEALKTSQLLEGSALPDAPSFSLIVAISYSSFKRLSALTKP